MEISVLEKNYEDFTQKSKTIGKKIATTVSMLQLDSVNESVATAVLQMEGMVSKKPSRFESIPLIGKLMVKAKDNIEHQTLKNASMVEVVDRLFSSLTEKKDNMMQVMETLFGLKELLIEDVKFMIDQESLAKNIAIEGVGIETTKAKNLLVQVSQSIIKSRDRIGIIDATCKSAEASTIAVSQLLPALQGELITEMAIQAGLQELKDFKEIFDNTLSVVNELSQENNSSMIKVLEDVVDLTVVRSTDIVRLENNANARNKTQSDLMAKMTKARADQEKEIETLGRIRQTQQVLELK